MSQSLEELGERLFLGIEAVSSSMSLQRALELGIGKLSQSLNEKGERLHRAIEAVC